METQLVCYWPWRNHDGIFDKRREQGKKRSWSIVATGYAAVAGCATRVCPAPRTWTVSLIHTDKATVSRLPRYVDVTQLDPGALRKKRKKKFCRVGYLSVTLVGDPRDLYLFSAHVDDVVDADAADVVRLSGTNSSTTSSSPTSSSPSLGHFRKCWSPTGGWHARGCEMVCDEAGFIWSVPNNFTSSKDQERQHKSNAVRQLDTQQWRQHTLS